MSHFIITSSIENSRLRRCCKPFQNSIFLKQKGTKWRKNPYLMTTERLIEFSDEDLQFLDYVAEHDRRPQYSAYAKISKEFRSFFLKKHLFWKQCWAICWCSRPHLMANCKMSFFYKKNFFFFFILKKPKMNSPMINIQKSVFPLSIICKKSFAWNSGERLTYFYIGPRGFLPWSNEIRIARKTA